MSYLNLVSVPRRHSVMALAALVGLLCSQRDLPAAASAELPVQQKVVVGRAALIPGALLHKDGDAWRLIAPQADIYADDLIVAVPAGAINSKSRNVRLTLLSDLARTSPYPVYESAVILHDTPLDLDFTLDRGRVDVTNIARNGEAKIRVRFQKQSWELTLGEKARVAFELFGRWPAGVRFSRTPKPDETPTLDLVMVVKEGQVSLKAEGKEFAMSAPPGAAYYHWDSVPPFDETPRRLESLPAWTRIQIPVGSAAEIAKLIRTIISRARDNSASMEEALASTLNDESPSARRMAVYGLGAIDDLPRLIDVLSSNKHQDTRDVSVIALRHWIGRGEGQDQKLYDALLKKGFSEKNANAVMQLLHSFSDEQKARPATYETLIELLHHENPAVRQLAGWHLARLVPSANIEFNALGSEAERQTAIDAWKKLIPAGKLPPKAKAEK
jgi:hypothetical protein